MEYRIKQLREEKLLSQRALAKQIGVSAKAVNFWESGAVEPSAKSVCALADFFECSADYLLGREDELGNVNLVREISASEKLWLDTLNLLDDKSRAQALDYASYLASKRIKAVK